ncbi:MAG: hypothetical protein SRB2_04039 [Desulfobacteraceae bacterium Eth-SRB2]|nr:MAG: hypothetical protein SRB2_04039 [Desulfobacteraceae bacterium Eth-SRB2]
MKISAVSVAKPCNIPFDNPVAVESEGCFVSGRHKEVKFMAVEQLKKRKECFNGN